MPYRFMISAVFCGVVVVCCASVSEVVGMSGSNSMSVCSDMVVYELKALVKLVLKDPDNEEYKNSIREIVNDHIRTYERPRDGEGYANYVHICCCPLMDNKFTKEFSHEIWSALDSREPLRIADE